MRIPRRGDTGACCAFFETCTQLALLVILTGALLNMVGLMLLYRGLRNGRVITVRPVASAIWGEAVSQSTGHTVGVVVALACRQRAGLLGVWMWCGVRRAVGCWDRGCAGRVVVTEV